MAADENRVLLAHLLDEKTGTPSGSLSASQQPYWVLHQMTVSIPMHVMCGYEISGAVELEALQSALAHVGKRYEVFRTAFVSVEGTALPLRSAAAFVAVPVMDLSGLAKRAREDELNRLAEREARQPFDATAPLRVRATLVKLASDRHAMIVAAHQRVADRTSLHVLIRDLAATHAASEHGDCPAAATSEPPRFKTFAGRQRGRRETEAARDEIAPLAAELAGVPLLQPPADRPRPQR